MMLYSLHKVIQRYNGRIVLDIDGLEIEAGRIHALLGPNGAGKTTLLHLLAFLETPASGQVVFRGASVEYSPKNLLLLRRRVVLVDQHPVMFSTTVAKNIEFGLKIRKIEKTERQRIVSEVLATVGLSRYKDARGFELSGGETQRLALARALALSPEVLLCDEPTASVDDENQAIIVDLLRQINAERSTTIVFTTHDRLQAATLAQQTLMLESGRLATASHENSYACTVLPQPGGRLHCRLHGCEVDIPLPAEQGFALSPTTSGRVRIDSQKITLCRIDAHASPAMEQGVTGTVMLIMAEGKRVRVVVNAGVLITAHLQHADYARLQPAIGEIMGLCFTANALSFQDS